MSFSKPSSLREKFSRAFHREQAHQKIDQEIIAGLSATEKEFYDRFVQISGTAEQTLHRVTEDIASGRNMAQRPLDVPCMGDISPLRWIVPIPNALNFSYGSQKDYDQLMAAISANAGYKALHALCSRQDIDVDIDIKIVSASCTDPSTGKRQSYDSVVIDIDMSRPYFREQPKTSPKKPGM